MFLRRIPYQSVRRRSIRHWLLLLPARARRSLLIVAAFARPFFPQGALAAARRRRRARGRRPARSVGEHGLRRPLAAGARDAAHKAIDALGGDDRATLVLFARNAEENVRATTDRPRLEPGDRRREGRRRASTRYGPALKLAQSILSASSLKRKEVVLVSDFQKTGWTGAEEIHLPEGTVLTPVSVAGAGDARTSSMPSVDFARASFSGQERITVTAGIVNRGERAGQRPDRPRSTSTATRSRPSR